MFPKCHQSITKVLPKYYQSSSKVLPKCYFSKVTIVMLAIVSSNLPPPPCHFATSWCFSTQFSTPIDKLLHQLVQTIQHCTIQCPFKNTLPPHRFKHGKLQHALYIHSCNIPPSISAPQIIYHHITYQRPHLWHPPWSKASWKSLPMRYIKTPIQETLFHLKNPPQHHYTPNYYNYTGTFC